jgi:hypothetical protein
MTGRAVNRGEDIGRLLSQDLPVNQQETISAYFRELDSIRKRHSGVDDLEINEIVANTGRFLISLPHEAASLRFDAGENEIADNTLTTPTTNIGNATWNYGMNIDTDNSKILFQGVPGESIVGAFAWWLWSDISSGETGERFLKINTTGGGAVGDLQYGKNHASKGTTNRAFNIRRMAAGESDFNVQVKQVSGGAMSGAGLLVVVRLR